MSDRFQEILSGFIRKRIVDGCSLLAAIAVLVAAWHTPNISTDKDLRQAARSALARQLGAAAPSNAVAGKAVPVAKAVDEHKSPAI